MRALLLPIVVAAMLTGCGYKGPLYLPKSKPEAQKPVKPPAAPPAEEKKTQE